ncbi:MAG TPA: adenylate cyclase [Candidatus Dormibacteraeota bacterium]|nr:adenylate cyclase [Candidatus Dormibacteraeota bacterium]
MRKLLVAALFVAPLALFGPLHGPWHAAALVTPTTGQPGAPNNTCGPDNPVTPGNSANAPGSPFNPNGTAGQNYAGNPGTSSLANSNSAAAVSQYDSACVHLSRK